MTSNNVILILYFFLPLLIYFMWKAYRRFDTSKKWSKAKRQNLTGEDQRTLDASFPPYLFLSSTEKDNLDLKIKYFLTQKRIEAIGDFKLSSEMRLLIAAHACLIITNMELDDIYPGLKNIYVMEGSYIEKDNPVNHHTGLPFHFSRLGESWKRGPIILSWDSIEQIINYSPKKHNLIIHEFSHHLDQQDGHFDGTPKLQTPLQFHHWANVMGKEFLKLRDKISHHQKTDIEAYGATNEAEFFAVCSEHFFTDPFGLMEKHPEVFQIYLDYFKIDPRKWHA
jgi:MtfA peptidase